jgi:ABC-type Na+ efflux pump permease subunit
MKTKTLTWSIAAILAVSAAVASATSYVPEAQTFGNVLSIALSLGALAAFGVALRIGRKRAE